MDTEQSDIDPIVGGLKGRLRCSCAGLNALAERQKVALLQFPETLAVDSATATRTRTPWMIDCHKFTACAGGLLPDFGLIKWARDYDGTAGTGVERSVRRADPLDCIYEDGLQRKWVHAVRCSGYRDRPRPRVAIVGKAEHGTALQTFVRQMPTYRGRKVHLELRVRS